MLLNKHKLNTNKLNVEPVTGPGTTFPGGIVISIAQAVGTSFSGLAVTFKQTVNLRNTYTGNNAITICQGVQHTSVNPLVIVLHNYVEDSSA